MTAAATLARSSRVAAARPSTPPVLVRAPRQLRRTPLAPSGRHRWTAGRPGQAGKACLISWRKSPRSLASVSPWAGKGRPAA
eukprot:14503043-Alexandrium_andersonii.AAC.1